MQSNWKTFLEAYNNAPTEIKKIIDGEHVADCVDSLPGINLVSELGRRELIVIIADALLLIIGNRVLEESIRTNKNLRPIYNPQNIRTILDFLNTQKGHYQLEPHQVLAESRETQPVTIKNEPLPQHGYGAGLTPEEPLYTSNQDSLMRISAKENTPPQS